MAAKIGTFEELLASAEPTQRPVLSRLRAILWELHPDACEVVRLGDRASSFGVGPKKMSEGYAYIMPHKSWVNLGFYRGALLEDPASLLEGTGAKMRHVKVRSLEAADQPALRALVLAAIAERKAALAD
ncbi:MAG: DUF1801 domain-containing protein [Proteobacteria bacterium]|nr:DUF1801 domain-containing protein [Pseudomonadota bacterium]